MKVATAGDVTEFRVTKSQAQDVKALLLQLMAGPSPAQPSQPAPAASVAGELRQLAELRDSGVLTEAEFTAQKTRLLGG